jgi:type VI secretion system protein ImpA
MDQPLDYANQFLTTAYGLDCATLLAPIDASRPQGDTLRGTPIWNAIRRARESDDASLPLGAWVRHLKRAAWGEVARASLDALAYRSKDLQLAIWLAEALLQEHGFRGLAASIAIVDALCERYWDVMYPGGADGDFEHRANLFRWLNEKLVMPVRLVPLTAPVAAAATSTTASAAASDQSAEGVRRYTWSDCEQLRRQQQSTQTSNSRNNDNAEGIDAADVAKALAATADDVLTGHHAALTQALAALAKLSATLDQCFDNDPPGIGALRSPLEQILVFITAQMVQRGLPINAPARAPVPVSSAAVVPLTETISVEVTMTPPDATDADAREEAASASMSPVNARKRAYAQLAEAAAALVEIEPHSPVPYLVRKAVEWGSLNTAQLYDELFIQGRGQLNVFELLGLGTPQAEEGTS